ncbi:MAG: choice-of-anchor J domain-containing protein, partial [Prevotella sp.]|nr:choice-of-anchor J domain-containing protein [Prevotella sp.]
VIQDVEYPHAAEAMAYIVMDASHDGFNQSFAAHSGNKYLGSFAATTGPNNDWMISPELSGDAQTISFWAKTYTLQYGAESFEVLYSTTGKAVEDFTLVEAVDQVPNEWTEYSYNLPAGAKYFAIRCTSNDKFIFLVDDVTYVPANAAQQELSLIGYNVYRDGVKVNAEPVAEPSFIDATAAEGSHTYVVTVVYDKGESKASNAVVVEVTTGINTVSGKNIIVASGKRFIGLTNAEGMDVIITNADGRTVFSGNVENSATISVAPGTYIVKVGNTIVKALVK